MTTELYSISKTTKSEIIAFLNTVCNRFKTYDNVRDANIGRLAKLLKSKIVNCEIIP